MEFGNNSAHLSISKEQRLFIDFITRILKRRASLHSKQGPASSLNILQRLSLYMHKLEDSSKLYSLLTLAFSSFKIKELEFTHDWRWIPCWFKLPCHVNVHSLKSLRLTGVAVHQSTVDMLALNCPFLELLKFTRSKIFGTVIEFRSLSKVVKLYLVQTLFQQQGQLVINLPSLLSFYFSAGNCLRKYEFDMDIINAVNLTSIILRDVWMKNGLLLDKFLPRLPRLERLLLRPYRKTKRLRISSHCLKHLIVELNLVNLVELRIDAPNLKVLIYNHTFLKQARRLPRIFITNNLALRKSIVQLNLKHLNDVKFTEFLQKINRRSKYLELHMEGSDIFTIEDNNIQRYGKICGIKHVVLLDQSGFTSPTRECMTLCIGRVMRLFPNVKTVVASQVKYYRGEVFMID